MALSHFARRRAAGFDEVVTHAQRPLVEIRRRRISVALGQGILVAAP